MTKLMKQISLISSWGPQDYGAILLDMYAYSSSSLEFRFNKIHEHWFGPPIFHE